jgi:hypothetical protein
MPRGTGGRGRALRSSTWWGKTMTGASELYPPKGIDTGIDRGVTGFDWGQAAIRLTPTMPAFRPCKLIEYGSIVETPRSRSWSNFGSGRGLRSSESALAPPEVPHPDRYAPVAAEAYPGMHDQLLKLGPGRSIPVAHPEARFRTEPHSTVQHPRGNR